MTTEKGGQGISISIPTEDIIPTLIMRMKIDGPLSVLMMIKKRHKLEYLTSPRNVLKHYNDRQIVKKCRN